LAAKPRWLVLNKLDLLPEEDREAACAALLKRLKWKGTHFAISAIAGEGCAALTAQIMRHIEAQREAARAAAVEAQRDGEAWDPTRDAEDERP
jgi:GTP-binding protein